MHNSLVSKIQIVQLRMTATKQEGEWGRDRNQNVILRRNCKSDFFSIRYCSNAFQAFVRNTTKNFFCLICANWISFQSFLCKELEVILLSKIASAPLAFHEIAFEKISNKPDSQLSDYLGLSLLFHWSFHSVNDGFNWVNIAGFQHIKSLASCPSTST